MCDEYLDFYFVTGKEVMKDLVVQLSYEYPSMFRECEGMELKYFPVVCFIQTFILSFRW